MEALAALRRLWRWRRRLLLELVLLRTIVPTALRVRVPARLLRRTAPAALRRIAAVLLLLHPAAAAPRLLRRPTPLLLHAVHLQEYYCALV